MRALIMHTLSPKVGLLDNQDILLLQGVSIKQAPPVVLWLVIYSN